MLWQRQASGNPLDLLNALTQLPRSFSERTTTPEGPPQTCVQLPRAGGWSGAEAREAASVQRLGRERASRFHLEIAEHGQCFGLVCGGTKRAQCVNCLAERPARERSVPAAPSGQADFHSDIGPVVGIKAQHRQELLEDRLSSRITLPLQQHFCHPLPRKNPRGLVLHRLGPRQPLGARVLPLGLRQLIKLQGEIPACPRELGQRCSASRLAWTARERLRTFQLCPRALQVPHESAGLRKLDVDVDFVDVGTRSDASRDPGSFRESRHGPGKISATKGQPSKIHERLRLVHLVALLATDRERFAQPRHSLGVVTLSLRDGAEVTEDEGDATSVTDAPHHRQCRLEGMTRPRQITQGHAEGAQITLIGSQAEDISASLPERFSAGIQVAGALQVTTFPVHESKQV